MAIHPTAIIDPQAEIDGSADIGPYVVIEGRVRIGAGTRLRAHVFVSGWTRIGERCDIHPFAVIGHLPQDFHYNNERSYCTIGNDVIIREGATIHRGTQPESETVIGDSCFLMAQAHVGHNCILGKNVKVYNYAAVAGHVEIGDGAILSGAALVHQFARVGKLAFIAAGARATMDVPAFMIAYGESSIIQHNRVGMRRAGYTPEELFDIRKAYSILYRSGITFPRAVEQLAKSVTTRAGRELLDFLRAETRRGICGRGGSARYRSSRTADEAEA